MMKIFVTGATGFVGTAVVKALLQRNHEVVGLVRGGGKGKALEQLGMTPVIGDMLEPASYVGVVQTVDVVINTAQYAIQGRFTQKKLKQIEHADALFDSKTRKSKRRCTGNHTIPHFKTDFQACSRLWSRSCR